VKNTTSTGVLSIASAGDFPTLNQNTTGIADNVKLTDALSAPGTYFLTMAPNAASGGLLIEPTKLSFTQSTGLLSTTLIKITGGTPGANKALLSDDDGDASWSASALGSAAYTATSSYDAAGTAVGQMNTHEATYTHSNIATAYNDRMKWDGGTGAWFNATTGRSSLGLGTAATANLGTGAGDAALGNHAHSNYANTSIYAHGSIVAGGGNWDVGAYPNASITPSGNINLNLQNIIIGTSGNLTVIAPASAYTITITTSVGANVLISPAIKTGTATFTCTSGGFDVFSWYYDGEYLFWNGTKGYQ
jgi:hypothetical protein